MNAMVNEEVRTIESGLDALTEGHASVLLFDMWQEMLINGDVPDCKRYREEFFEFYGNAVKSEHAPIYLMFCAFVGAMDMNNEITD